MSRAEVDGPALAKAVKKLEDVRNALVVAIEHYSDQEKINNHTQPWYSNAKDAYEEKLHKVDALILTLGGKYSSLQAGSATPQV